METLSRADRIKIYLTAINEHKEYLKNNEHRLKIYRGKLKPYIDEILKNTLSENYYNQIKARVIPINVLPRIIDKLSKVYIDTPIRKHEKYQAFIDRVEKDSNINAKMAIADTYSHLFKCYAVEPYLSKGKINLRVLSADKFIPISMDEENPLIVTDMIKIMGNDKYFAYTDDEFFAFDSKGKELTKYYVGNDGKNLYGIIPIMYASRSDEELTPTEDTDLIQMTKMIPVMLTDLGGAIMFQCFTIIYGINITSKELKLSPNAFWDLKSDDKAEKGNPVVGTIKPEADIGGVVNFIKEIFVLWLETKGVRIGSLNNVDAGNASGIAKIIDEMDVYEVKKSQIVYFKDEETRLWKIIGKMNNFWMTSEDGYKSEIIGDDFEVSPMFNEPRPEIPRTTQVDNTIKEYDKGIIDEKTAISTLYPDLKEEELVLRETHMKVFNEKKNNSFNSLNRW